MFLIHVPNFCWSNQIYFPASGQIKTNVWFMMVYVKYIWFASLQILNWLYKLNICSFMYKGYRQKPSNSNKWQQTGCYLSAVYFESVYNVKVKYYFAMFGHTQVVYLYIHLVEEYTGQKFQHFIRMLMWWRWYVHIQLLNFLILLD